MVGLLDERPGRRRPLRLSPEVLAPLESRRREMSDASGAQLARELEAPLGVRLHRHISSQLEALRGAGVSVSGYAAIDADASTLSTVRQNSATSSGLCR